VPSPLRSCGRAGNGDGTGCYPRPRLDDRIYTELYELEERHWWFRGRRAVIRALIDRAALGPRPDILDAGCGTGANLVHFGALGRALGVDPSPEAVSRCRQRGLDGVVQG